MEIIEGNTSQRIVKSFNNVTHPLVETHHDIRTQYQDTIEISQRMKDYLTMTSSEIKDQIDAAIDEAIELVNNEFGSRQSIYTDDLGYEYEDLMSRIGACLVVLFNIIQEENPSRAMICKLEYWFWHQTAANKLLLEKNQVQRVKTVSEVMDAFVRLVESSVTEQTQVPEFALSENLYREVFHEMVQDLNEFTKSCDGVPLQQDGKTFCQEMGRCARTMMDELEKRPIEPS
jgi:hypothetical protein